MFFNRRGSNILEPRLQCNGARQIFPSFPWLETYHLWKSKKCISRIVEWSDMISFSDFPQLHLSSRYFGRWIFSGLQYIGARAPLYWSPLTTIFRNIILWLIENHFLSWINPIQMDWVLLNLIGVIAKKYFWFTSLLCKKHIWWAPIYWSLGSIILEPRLHYIGAPSVQQTCFLFYFWTWNTANKRFPVH